MLAEINYRAGRREQADLIWAQVHAQTPGDVWFHDHIGVEKHHGGQHDQAVEWLGHGLDLPGRQGDPEHLVGQMAALRASSLRALDRPDDDVQHQASTFFATTGTPRRVDG